MFRISRKRLWPPIIETTTLRSELGQLCRDLEQIPQLRQAAMIITDAIDELENAEMRSRLHHELQRFDIRKLKKPGP